MLEKIILQHFFQRNNYKQTKYHQSAYTRFAHYLQIQIVRMGGNYSAVGIKGINLIIRRTAQTYAVKPEVLKHRNCAEPDVQPV